MEKLEIETLPVATQFNTSDQVILVQGGQLLRCSQSLIASTVLGKISVQATNYVDNVYTIQGSVQATKYITIGTIPALKGCNISFKIFDSILNFKHIQMEVIKSGATVATSTVTDQTKHVTIFLPADASALVLVVQTTAGAPPTTIKSMLYQGTVAAEYSAKI